MAMLIVWLAEATPWMHAPFCPEKARLTGCSGNGASGLFFRVQDARIEADVSTSQEQYRAVTFACKM
jgi:hypothetical protein